MTRGAAVAAFIVIALLSSSIGGIALAADSASAAPSVQQNNSTATPAPVDTAESQSQEDDWEPPGPFSITELRAGGEHPSNSPPSVRYLYDNSGKAVGGIAFQYRPANPLDNEPVMLESGQELNTDTIEMYSTVFNPDALGDYTLVLVYWQQDQKQITTENGTQTVTYAANQSVQRATFDLGEGYDRNTIRLNSHYQTTVKTTAWLEHEGEPIPGARWVFDHASLPASQQIQIQTRADAWWYVVRTAILPGVAAILLGLTGAKATLRRTGTGPRYGLGLWIFAGFIGSILTLAGVWYEINVVIANLEILLGLSLGVVAYGGGLRMHPPVDYVGFERKELKNAVALRRGGDEKKQVKTDGGKTDVVEIPEEQYVDELYEELPRIPTVPTEDGWRRIPKKGGKPFLARLFANAADLNLSNLRTRVKVAKGCIDEKIYVDPESEPAVELTPAHLERRLPVWHRVSEDSGTVERVLYAALTLAVVGLPVIGWHVSQSALNTGLVGAGVGAVLLAVVSYTAEDGEIDYDPAPRHDVTADASLTILQNEHADAKLLEDYEEIAWEERSRSALEARNIESRRDKTMVQQMNENALGMDVDVQRDETEKEADDLLGGPQDDDTNRSRAETDGGAEDVE